MSKIFIQDFIFQPARKTAAEWAEENPVLRDGEFGVGRTTGGGGRTGTAGSGGSGCYGYGRECFNRRSRHAGKRYQFGDILCGGV